MRVHVPIRVPLEDPIKAPIREFGAIGPLLVAHFSAAERSAIRAPALAVPSALRSSGLRNIRVWTLVKDSSKRIYTGY